MTVKNRSALSADLASYITSNGVGGITGAILKARLIDLLDSALLAEDVGTAASLDTGTGAGNVPVLDENGLLASAVLPALAITDTSEVESESAMLALAAQKGDLAIRTDVSKTFILTSDSPSTLADWKEIKSPTDVVQSVAGLTGTITASALRTALSLVIGTDILGVSNNLSDVADAATARSNLKIVTIEQSAYDALDPPDAGTVYLITEDA